MGPGRGFHLVGKQSTRQRAEIIERSFAHNLERGGTRRTWLRGRENVHKHSLIHVAGPQSRNPDALADRRRDPFRCFNYRDDTLAIVIFALNRAGLGIRIVIVIVIVIVATEPDMIITATSSTGC